MDGRDQFSDEEWAELRELPILAAALISAVDYSRLSEGKEFAAFADFIRQAGGRQRRSPLIAAIPEDTADAEIERFRDLCDKVAHALSADKPMEKAIARVKDAGRLVDERLPPKQAASYKSFVMEVASVVARAHKESIIPFASPISHTEDFYIRRLAKALRL